MHRIGHFFSLYFHYKFQLIFTKNNIFTIIQKICVKWLFFIQMFFCSFWFGFWFDSDLLFLVFGGRDDWLVVFGGSGGGGSGSLLFNVFLVLFGCVFCFQNA